MNLTEEICARLAVLGPLSIELHDESAGHAGHAGSGGAHFILIIVSSHFSGKTRIMRHRDIYRLLGDLIPFEIHALSIQAYAPDEL
jgi:BolA protein